MCYDEVLFPLEHQQIFAAASAVVAAVIYAHSFILYYRDAFALKVYILLLCCRRRRRLRHWLWFSLMWLKINANILIACYRERERGMEQEL